MSSVLAYCRPGYEVDLGNELLALATEKGLYGYPQFKANSGFVQFVFHQDADAESFVKTQPVDQTIFARQLFEVLADVVIEDKSDRIGPIVSSLTELADVPRSGLLFVEHADTEAGKELAKLCKKIAVPMRQAFRKQGWLTKAEQTKLPAMHVFFTDTDRCFVGVSDSNGRSPFANGICRLKFPSQSPSRSTLKLEEALLLMLTDEQREAICRPGARAVDLGACPGGWTYQLVSREMHVEAVDNGKMADHLMATGLVDYRPEDGFRYKPQFGQVELLVCDMIEKPDRVADLMASWLCKRWTNHAIFNLKLPMKRRYETVYTAIQSVKAQLAEQKIRATINVRHLYHDRDEVTVAVIRAL